MRYISVAAITAFAWTLTAVAVLLTLGRFAIHWKIRKHISLCDALNGVAAFFLLAFFVSWETFFPNEYQAALDEKGAGKGAGNSVAEHKINVNFDIKMNLANSMFFWCCIYSVKASFLAMYWSIFGRDAKFKLAWAIAVVYHIAALVTTIVVRLNICGRPNDVLNRKACLREVKHKNLLIMVTWCLIDGVGDIILTLLPMMMLRQMFIRRSQKIQLTFLFGIVALNLATNILRTVYTIKRDLNTAPHLNAVWDYTPSHYGSNNLRASMLRESANSQEIEKARRAAS
ncbi:hypothetical protein N0V90_007002 [Kalmusia sp. IMI 367209]|nr:hypothetical protein N0V90_007002 [Kalmusia sp. IMI 367209]